MFVTNKKMIFFIDFNKFFCAQFLGVQHSVQKYMYYGLGDLGGLGVFLGENIMKKG